MEYKRRDEKPVRGNCGEESDAERDAERERPGLRVALQRADRLRFGHAMLDEVRHAGRSDRQDESCDHRRAQQNGVLGRV